MAASFILDGPIEADETFIGASPKLMNKKAKKNYSRTWSGDSKTAVFAMVERKVPGMKKGRARAMVVPFIEKEFLQGNIRKNVLPGDVVYTDGFPAYKTLKKDYKHHVIDHAYEYVRDHVHTNSIEAFFSVLKRTIKGTYRLKKRALPARFFL